MRLRRNCWGRVLHGKKGGTKPDDRATDEAPSKNVLLKGTGIGQSKKTEEQQGGRMCSNGRKLIVFLREPRIHAGMQGKEKKEWLVTRSCYKLGMRDSEGGPVRNGGVS